ncbi:MAG: hypothetical protein J6V26_00790 [Alistipes sp.]|nr:hypothetical protein [Alistipes sp.]
MRESIKHMMIAMAGLVLVACNSIYEFGDCPSFDEPHSVSFVLAIDPPGTTRAAWGDSEPSDEIGTGFENRILPESLRVEIYTADNSYVGEVEELVYWPISEDGNRYQFQGKVPVALLDSAASLPVGTTPNYKFMVFANCDRGDNASITYEFDDLDFTSGAIPMWGVKQADITNLLNDRVQQLGTISLLRAVAKVEIIVDEALSGCTINEASINYHNRQGYVLPTGWDTAVSTTSLDRDGVFRGYRSIHTLPHSFVEVEAGRKFVFYLPEYDNTLFADYEAKVSVNVNYNATQLNFPDALQFKNYENGKPMGEAANIVRNTIYRFRITQINSGGLVLNYEVADWERSDNWEWVQHFDYPNYHNPVLPDTATRDGDSSNDVYPAQPEMYYTAPNERGAIVTEEGAFSCWFQMVNPIGQTWLPTLRTASDRCDIRVYKELDSMVKELVYTTESSVTDASLKDGSKLVAYGGWYNIKVIPTDPAYTGVARFGITYTQDWMGAGARYLLINGEVDHIIWPNSGSEPRIIDIQQVSN